MSLRRKISQQIPLGTWALLLLLASCTSSDSIDSQPADLHAASACEELFARLESSRRKELSAQDALCTHNVASAEGELQVLIEENAERKTEVIRYQLETEDKDYLALELVGSPETSESSSVVVSGFRLTNDAILADARAGLRFIDRPVPVPTEEPTPEPEIDMNVLILMTNFVNTYRSVPTVSEVEEAFFGPEGSVKDFFEEISYDRFNVSGDVRGWFRVGIEPMCNTLIARDLAMAEAYAADPTLNFADYSHVVIVAPYWPCTWSGIAQTRGYPVATPSGPAEFATIGVQGYAGANIPIHAHEIIHTFGVLHSVFLDCGLDGFDSPSCTLGVVDPYTIMGNAYYLSHPNAAEKEKMGILSAAKIKKVTQSGTYNLIPLSSSGEGKRTLVIDRGIEGQEKMFIEFRQPTGFDANLGFESDVSQGTLLRLATTDQFGISTRLIDATVPPAGDAYAAALIPGSTFTDPVTGTVVETLSVSPTGSNVRVTLGSMPPGLQFLSPEDPDAVGGLVSFRVNATSSLPVEKVEFSINGWVLETDVSEPYEMTLDLSTTENGMVFTITAEASNSLQQVGSQEITVTVQNP